MSNINSCVIEATLSKERTLPDFLVLGRQAIMTVVPVIHHFNSWLVWLLQKMPPETAHLVALTLLQMKTALWPTASTTDCEDPILAIKLWKRDFPNPIGLAAGFDKNAKCVNALFGLGFGFVEIGTVTPTPQEGNPPPRLFRLLADKALINRMGFNNDGLEIVAHRLTTWQRRIKSHRRRPLGINLGQNRDSVDAIADYIQGISVAASLVDYVVINISSPNTPGLQDLQSRHMLVPLVRRIREVLDQAVPLERVRPPLLVKIAPDLTPAEQADIAEVTLDYGLDGLIATNTTKTRSRELLSHARNELGGLSGRPLFLSSTAVLANLYRLTCGRVPLIGVGGIESGADALYKIKAGASLVQVYTAVVYEGPNVVRRIKTELAQLLRTEGYRTVSEAVGVGIELSLSEN